MGTNSCGSHNGHASLHTSGQAANNPAAALAGNCSGKGTDIRWSERPLSVAGAHVQPDTHSTSASPMCCAVTGGEGMEGRFWK